MPSWRLTSIQEMAPQHAIVAMDSDATKDVEPAPGTGRGRGVQHVGVLANETRVCADALVAVFHMQPPVGHGPMPAHAVGVAASLDPARLEDIAVWLATVQTEMAGPGAAMPAGTRRQKILHLFRDYIVRPAVKWAADKQTRRKRYLGFSCSGFVAECYAEGAGLPLVVPEENLPEVHMADLRKVWGRLLALVPADDPDRWLAERGLDGPGPWPILLPAYLLHAMNEGVLPYRPDVPRWAF